MKRLFDADESPPQCRPLRQRLDGSPHLAEFASGQKAFVAIESESHLRNPGSGEHIERSFQSRKILRAGEFDFEMTQTIRGDVLLERLGKSVCNCRLAIMGVDWICQPHGVTHIHRANRLCRQEIAWARPLQLRMDRAEPQAEAAATHRACKRNTRRPTKRLDHPAFDQ